MAIQGLRHSGNFATNERPENWRKGYLLRYPTGKAPLVALTSMMKSEVTNDPVFHWWEKELNSRRFALTVSLTAPASGTADTLTVSSGALGLKRGDLLYVENSGETMWVSQSPSSDTSIPVIRGHSSSTPAVVTVGTHNPNIFVIGSAFEEGSEAPPGVNFDPTEIFNHTQIFRSTIEATRTAMKTQLRTTDQVKEAKRECLEYHNIDLERAFWFGRYGVATVNGKPQRMTRGIVNFLPSENVIDQAGTALKMTVLEGWLEQFFRFGSTEKMVFCGNRVVTAINQTVRKNADMNIESGIKEFGMDVTKLFGPHGTLVFKTHPLFNQHVSAVTPASPTYWSIDSWAFVVDMDNIKYRYLTDSDTKYSDDLQIPGMDGKKSGYLTECGLEVHHAKTHFLIKGIASGAVDS